MTSSVRAGAGPVGGGRCGVVLGAGIQGCCVALALVRDGWRVTLLDRASEPMRETSLRGEGKIHTGYVYANDPTLSTAHLMAAGALRFSDLLDRWLPRPAPWPRLRSEPFHYAVLPDTMVSVDALAAHYARVDDDIEEGLAAGQTYVGASTYARAEGGRDAWGLSPDVAFAFRTSEVAVLPTALRAVIVAGLTELGVRFTPGITVHGVQRTPAGFAVDAMRADGSRIDLEADVVVNCLWHGRLAIDATMGIAPSRPWLYRLKHGIWGRLRSSELQAPSVTVVLGPYGDTVRYADGSMYASWYPACMTASVSSVAIPDEWSPYMDGSGHERHAIAERTVEALSSIVPAMRDFVVDAVAAGVIVAWGETDIDDRQSVLHRRSEVGVHAHDGYYSVDTGKLTLAPLFADRVCRLVS